MPHPLLEALEHLLMIDSEPTILHYDTVFNIGDYYLSTVTFRHSLYNENPIIPCGFLIHSRRYHCDHKTFIEAITSVVHPLTTRHVNIVTDREFNFADSFPVGTHLYCWNHLINDLRWHLRNKCNCSTEEINYFVNAFKNIQTNICEVEFDRDWQDLKVNKMFTKRPKITNYFEDNLIPAFKNHGSIWGLKAAGIPSVELGITNNPSESMNAMLHRLQKWKNVPLDVIAVSLYHLCIFYQRELTRSIHQCGWFVVKDKFGYHKIDPSLLPLLQPAIDPKDIVDRCVTENWLTSSASSTDVKPVLELSSSDSNYDEVLPDVSSNTTVPISCNTQISLAQLAIKEGRIKLAENGYGAWIVMENDGTTPCAVKLFPKETCSCSSSKNCCHIMACRMMIGLMSHESGRANLAETFRNNRKNRKDHLGGKNHAKETLKSLKAKNQMQMQQVCELTIEICSCTCSYVSYIVDQTVPSPPMKKKKIHVSDDKETITPQGNDEAHSSPIFPVSEIKSEDHNKRCDGLNFDKGICTMFL